MMVLFGHLTSGQAIPHYYMAVDMFFVMSGFVLAIAYEQKILAGMSPLTFMRHRVTRLWPLLAVGVIIGAFGDLSRHDPLELGALILRGLFLVPQSSDPSDPNLKLFVLNFASWSLLCEIMVNMFYAYLVRTLKLRALIFLLSTSLFFLLLTVFRNGSFEFGAWASNGLSGLIRAIFPFFLGIGLARLWQAGRLPRTEVSPVLLMCALILVCVIPTTGSATVLLETAVSLLLIPAMIIAGVSAFPDGKALAACEWLGRLSYPIYILQSGFILVFRRLSQLGAHPWGAGTAIMALVTFAIVIMTSWIAVIYLDQPLQRWIKDRQRTLAPATGSSFNHLSHP